MKIAVVQLKVTSGHRAATLQHALHAIDRAAETDPAPDLIILPAFGDVPHLLAGRALPGEAIEGPIVAACAYHARQWGVWIAFGFAERGKDKPYSTSVLLDVDGDVFFSQRQIKFGASGRARFSPGASIAAADTPIGRIGLLSGDDVFDETAWKASAYGGVDLIVATGCFLRDARSPVADPDAARDRLSELSTRFRTVCAIADVTTEAGERPDCAGFSVIIGAKGSAIASALPREDALLCAVATVSIRKPASTGGGA